MAEIIRGRAVAKAYRAKIKVEAEALTAAGVIPGLAVIIVGDNPASQIYVKHKKLDCEECSIHSEIIALPESSSEADVLDEIRTLNKRSDIHGILVQMPLPKHINPDKMIGEILPEKDVDAFNPVNVGKIMIGDFDFLPCTPAGVMALLDEYNIPIEGMECVVIGRSNIVGKPQAMLLLHRNATVTICHSKTKNLAEVCRRADILIAAAGRRNLVTADMVKDGVTVIDVAMNTKEDGKLCGDIDFDEVSKKAAYITPVPGGVGPMTRVMLLKNTLTAARNLSAGKF